MESLELRVGGHEYTLVGELYPNEDKVGVAYFSSNGIVPKNLEQLRNIFNNGYQIWKRSILARLTQRGKSAIIIYDKTMRIIAHDGFVFVGDDGATNLKEVVDSYNGK